MAQVARGWVHVRHGDAVFRCDEKVTTVPGVDPELVPQKMGARWYLVLKWGSCSIF